MPVHLKQVPLMQEFAYKDTTYRAMRVGDIYHVTVTTATQVAVVEMPPEMFEVLHENCIKYRKREQRKLRRKKK